MAIKQRRRRGVVGIARSNRVCKGSVVIDCIVLIGYAQKKHPPGSRRAGVGNDAYIASIMPELYARAT